MRARTRYFSNCLILLFSGPLMTINIDQLLCTNLVLSIP